MIVSGGDPDDLAGRRIRFANAAARTLLRLPREGGLLVAAVRRPEVLEALGAAGGPLAGLDEAARIDVVRRLEATEPALFGWVRDAAYVVYYENPFVAEVINRQGHLYELRPHLKG